MKLKRIMSRMSAWVALSALVLSALVAVTPSTSANAVIGSPGVGVTPAGGTSVAHTPGKAQGSGLWGYAGNVQTRSSGMVFTYGLAFSPVDESLWVTDSAKIHWTQNASYCERLGGTQVDTTVCYVGDSQLNRYALVDTPDWSQGQYDGNGTYEAPTDGANAGIGANYATLADAQQLDGSAMPSGQFGGVRGVAVANDGVAWVLDSDAGYSWLNHDNHALRMVNPDGTEENAIGKTEWPNGIPWVNRHDPEAFDYAVGIARMNNGDLVVTSQTPELLKQYRPDGSFVRNIYLRQAADTLFPGDMGYRQPYSITVDPSDGTLLVGFSDSVRGIQTFIQRIDPENCTTESVGNPTGSSRDSCAVLDTIGLGKLATGNGQTHATFVVQVEPRTGDIYVGQRSGLVSIFGSDGAYKGKFSAFGQGSGNGQVTTVRGIAFDDRGFLYLTTAEGSDRTRVEIFARTPDPLTGLTGEYSDPSKTSADLSWDALPSGVSADAQSPLRDYVVEQSSDNGATWAVAETSTSTAARATVAGLDPAQKYLFRVSAWNEAGNGDTAVIPLRELPSEISLVKTGNGFVAETSAVAVQVPAGSEVTFEYTLSNDGESPVTGIELFDSDLGTVTAPEEFDGTLLPGATVQFSATGAIGAGPYSNTATIEAVSEGQTVTASDEWFGFGVVNDLTVEKTGNGVHAVCVDSPHYVDVDSNVEFAYLITNDGNTDVTISGVMDSELGTIVAPETFAGVLAPGASVTYTHSGPVGAGAYHNTVDVTAIAAGGEALIASDEWFGFGVVHDLTVVKTGNGVAAACAKAPHHVPADSTVAFEYEITNNGNTAVTIGEVIDSELGVIVAPDGFTGVLNPDESVTFSATGPVGLGAYSNTVEVTATAEGGGQPITGSDQWFGFGVVNGLTVQKTGDGVIAESPELAEQVAAGTLVEFAYTVTNTGNAAVDLGTVADNVIGGIAAPSDFTGVLHPNATVTYRSSGVVAAGSYTNRVDVEASAADGADLLAADDWFGFGAEHDITVVKTGAGVEASSAQNPYFIAADAEVEFAYLITNNGNTAVTIGAVVDSELGEVTAPDGFTGVLDGGKSVTFTRSGPVAAGAYHNTVEVTAVSGDDPLTATDEWFGFGVENDLSVVKTGDGVTTASVLNAHLVDADTVVDFTYLVTNNGNTAVTINTVVDSELGSLSVPDGLSVVLDAGESITFSAFGPVGAGAYRNTVEVNATVDGSGENLLATDDWFAVGVVRELTVVKTGNGVATDSADSPHHVAADSLVAFEYVLTNGGNTAVTIDKVTDSELGEVSLPEGFTGVLGAGEQITYTASGLVGAGSYTNRVAVSATAADGAEISARDDWFGYGDAEPVSPGPAPGPGAPPGTDPPPALGETGSATHWPVVWVALLLLGVGAALAFVRRRS